MDTKSKSKLLTRSAYVIFTVMAVAVLCITLYAVVTFVSRRHQAPEETPQPGTEQTEPKVTLPPVTQPPAPATEPPATEPPASSDSPTDAEPLQFFMPAQGTVISAYSADMPVYSPSMNDYRVHCGVDIGAELGAEVYACAAGTVTDVYSDDFMGQCITIDHGDGLKSHYMNLSAELPSTVKVGAAVSGGQLIGAVGDTAPVEIAQSPHLHFAMTQNAASVDPASYLPELKNAQSDSGAQE